MLYATGLILLPLSYLVTAVSLAALFTAARFPAKQPNFNLIFSMPLAPILQAWLLWVSFKLFPGHGVLFYILVVMAICLSPLVFLPVRARDVVVQSLTAIGAIFKYLTGQIRRYRVLSLISSGAVLLIILTIVQIFILPVLASDPLEYLAVAKVIFADRSMVQYPVDPSAFNGLYARSAHPPGYHMMIVWSFLFQGSADSSVFPRFIQLHYLVSMLALFWYSLIVVSAKKLGGIQAMIGVICLLAVPFYLQLITDFHIDPMRITLFFLSFVVMARLIEWLNERKDILDFRSAGAAGALTGAITGLGMFAHSIGLLILPFVGFAYIVLVRLKLRHYFFAGAVVAFVALFFGAGQFLENTIRYGTPIHDAEPIWDLPTVDHKNDVRYRRELLTIGQRVVNGLLGWFSSPNIYGYIHWFLVLPGIFFYKRFWESYYSRLFTLGIVQFYLLAILTMSLGSDLMIKNYRYVITIVPFIAFFAGQFLGDAYEFVEKKIYKDS